MQIVQPIKDERKIGEIQSILLRQSVRDWLLFTIGINSGLHLHDLLLLRVRDVRNKSVVTAREDKTGKLKQFALTDELKARIADYIQGMQDVDFLFPSQRTGMPIKRIRVYRILKEAAKEVGLEDIGTHTLRKTYGYHYYQRTRDVTMLRELFNHSAPSVTLRYIGIN